MVGIKIFLILLIYFFIVDIDIRRVGLEGCFVFFGLRKSKSDLIDWKFILCNLQGKEYVEVGLSFGLSIYSFQQFVGNNKEGSDIIEFQLLSIFLLKKGSCLMMIIIIESKIQNVEYRMDLLLFWLNNVDK